MSRAPNQESFAELSRLPKPTNLVDANRLATKMIVALAREAGVIHHELDNYAGAEAIRDILAEGTNVPGRTVPAERTLPASLPKAPRDTAETVVRERFKPRTADEHQQQRMVGIRATFQAVEDIIVHVTPKGRYQSLVLTALEEACMWAIKAVSHENG